MKCLLSCVGVLSVVLVVSSGFGFSVQQSRIQEESTANSEARQEQTVDEQFAPVDDMHHFMEYISQPSYLALKEALAAEPENRRAWRPIKAHAMILTETSALVAGRVPEDADEKQTRQWKQISLDVYTAGKDLYNSIGDYQKAKENYGVMIDNCNRCHQAFDNGKHQLEK